MYKALLFLAIYLPFQIALNPAEGIDLASIRVFILLFFFVWLADSFKKKRIIFKNNIQAWLIVAFLILNAVSIAVAQNSNWSLRKLLFLFSIFPIYFVATAIINSREKMEKIMQALIWSGTAAAAIGIAQFVSQFIFGREAVYAFWANNIVDIFLGRSFGAAVLQYPSWLVGSGGQIYMRAISVFPDPHMFSFYLNLLIPLALGLFWAKGAKKMLGAAIIMLIANAMTFSRAGYFAALVGVAAGIIFIWKKADRKCKWQAVIILSVMILAFSVHNPASERFQSSFDIEEGSNQGRLGRWEEAAGLVKNNPAIGVGIGNYSLAIKPEANYREPIYAHNTYLDIAAETGILNAFIWMGILFFAIWKFYEKGKKEKLFFFGAAAILAFAVQSLADTAIYSPVVLALLLIVISFSNIDEKNSNG